MAKQIVEDENNLKRRARRRLIGAVALTLVVVVVLPMLLESEPKPVGKDIELRIPDKDKVGEFVPTMSMPSASAAMGSSVSSPVATSMDVASSAPTAAQALGTPSLVAAVPASKITSATPEEKNSSGAQPGFVVQVGSYTHADSAHNLQKKLKKLGIKTYTEKVGDKTRVRAGPYATREAADKVRHKLEAQGLKPVVSSAY